MWFFLVSALAWFLGLALGIWAGAFATPLGVIGEVTIPELLSLSFTILSGGAGIIATGFALFIYNQWRTQQRNSTVYDIKVSLLKQICSITIYANNMLLARAKPSITSSNDCKVNLITSMSSISIEAEILSVLDPKLKKLALEVMKLNQISAEIMNMRLFSATDSMEKIYIATDNEWFNDFVKGFFETAIENPNVENAISPYQIKVLNKQIDDLATEIKEKLRDGL